LRNEAFLLAECVAQAFQPLPFNGFCPLRRGFPTCFSLAFVPSFYEEKRSIETAYQEARADRRKMILMEDEASFYRQPTATWD